MMRIGLVVAILGALSAVASPADKKDPRETYSTDGWKLAWSKEFNGSYNIVGSDIDPKALELAK